MHLDTTARRTTQGQELLSVARTELGFLRDVLALWYVRLLLIEMQKVLGDEIYQKYRAVRVANTAKAVKAKGGYGAMGMKTKRSRAKPFFPSIPKPA